MFAAPLEKIVHGLRRSAEAEFLDDIDDAELVRRFLKQRDAAAFEALVRRHGPLVLAACHKVLRDDADVEDVFQATFLILLRDAGRIRKRQSVGPWLFGVAHRLAVRAQCATKQRKARERESARRHEARDLSWREACAALQEELDRLPDRLRMPLLLCCLEGKSRDEAAQQLGCSLNVVKKRLELGRAKLRSRLTLRGLALSAALLAAVADSAAAIELSPRLLESTLHSATTSQFSSTVAKLVAGAAAKRLSRKIWWLALALVGTAGLSAAVWSKSSVPVTPSAAVPSITRPVAPAWELQPIDAPLKVDPDALPPGARLRLGAVHFRHTHWVWGIAITADGKYLASASQDNTLRLWDRNTGKEVRRFVGHTGAVQAVTVSADGKTLASSGGDGTLRTWETATGREIRKIQFAKQGAIFAIALSPDGQTLAAGTVLWDLTTGKQRQVLGGKQTMVKAVTFSPDGKIIAVAGEDLQLWDAATGQPLMKPVGHIRWVSSVVFSPDGKTLCSGSHDGTIRTWDVTTGQELRQVQGQGGVFPNFGGPAAGGFNFHDAGVHSVALSRDGKLLASGGSNGIVVLWDAGTGKELHTIHALSREVRSLSFTPDGKVLATAGFDHVINLWDTGTGKKWLPSTGHDAPVERVAFSSDGRRIVSVGWDRTARVWDARTGQELHVLRPGGSFDRAAISPDGRLIATAEQPGILEYPEGKIKVWELDSGREVREWATKATSVQSISFSPDGKFLASTTGKNTWGEYSIQLWDPATGREVRTLKDDRKTPFWGIEFLADGKSVAVQSNDGVLVLDVETGKELRRFPGGRTLLHGGRVLLAAENSSWTRLCDVATGRELGRFEMPIQFVSHFACSPDGRMLARTLESDKHDAIELIEVASGKLRRLFEAHQGPVGAIAFSPDGKTLVSAGYDTTLLVWDLTGAKADTK